MTTRRHIRPRSSPDFIVGTAQIARHLGVSVKTLERWRKRHGFPCGKLPDGQRFTTRGLINQWVLARIADEGGKPNIRVGEIEWPTWGTDGAV